MGPAAVAAARNIGASTVIAVDIDGKLHLAKRMGADHLINAAQLDAAAEVRRLSRSEDGTEGVDYSVDCTGRADHMPKSVAALRPGVPGAARAGAKADSVHPGP